MAINENGISISNKRLVVAQLSKNLSKLMGRASNLQQIKFQRRRNNCIQDFDQEKQKIKSNTKSLKPEETFCKEGPKH